MAKDESGGGFFTMTHADRPQRKIQVGRLSPPPASSQHFGTPLRRGMPCSRSTPSLGTIQENKTSPASSFKQQRWKSLPTISSGEPAEPTTRKTPAWLDLCTRPSPSSGGRRVRQSTPRNFNNSVRLQPLSLDNSPGIVSKLPPLKMSRGKVGIDSIVCTTHSDIDTRALA